MVRSSRVAGWVVGSGAASRSALPAGGATPPSTHPRGWFPGAGGVRVFRTGEDERVVSVAWIAEQDEEEEG